jgi:hypothetical protein
MSQPRRRPPLALIVLGLVVAVVALTWVLEQVVPPPFSGYLAAVTIGLVAIQLYKRQPGPRAQGLFRIYLKARARGQDESAAREQLLASLHADEEGRRQAWRDIEPLWTGPTERDRVMGGVGALLARLGLRLEDEGLRRAYDRVRDRLTIAGWEALPGEFVEAVRSRLDEGEQAQLDSLVDRYRLFHQRFFQRPSSLATDLAASVEDFARLLHSVGNRMTREHPGDAERAYRLSLRLRPERNLAHAGLALLLEQTGRTREAADEARTALTVLDEFARRTSDGAPTTEDISPFRSPVKLREALEQVRGGRQAR